MMAPFYADGRERGLASLSSAGDAGTKWMVVVDAAQIAGLLPDKIIRGLFPE